MHAADRLAALHCRPSPCGPPTASGELRACACPSMLLHALHRPSCVLAQQSWASPVHAPPACRTHPQTSAAHSSSAIGDSGLQPSSAKGAGLWPASPHRRPGRSHWHGVWDKRRQPAAAGRGRLEDRLWCCGAGVLGHWCEHAGPGSRPALQPGSKVQVRRKGRSKTRSRRTQAAGSEGHQFHAPCHVLSVDTFQHTSKCRHHLGGTAIAQLLSQPAPAPCPTLPHTARTGWTRPPTCTRPAGAPRWGRCGTCCASLPSSPSCCR